MFHNSSNKKTPGCWLYAVWFWVSCKSPSQCSSCIQISPDCSLAYVHILNFCKSISDFYCSQVSVALNWLSSVRSSFQESTYMMAHYICWYTVPSYPKLDALTNHTTHKNWTNLRLAAGNLRLGYHYICISRRLQMFLLLELVIG